MLVFSSDSEKFQSNLGIVKDILEKKSEIFGEQQQDAADQLDANVERYLENLGAIYDKSGVEAQATVLESADHRGDPKPEPDREPPEGPPTDGTGLRKGTDLASPSIATPTSIDGLWRLPMVLSVIPISKSSWWAGVSSGRYPAPVRISRRCVAWRASDIRDLINSLT